MHFFFILGMSLSVGSDQSPIRQAEQKSCYNYSIDISEAVKFVRDSKHQCSFTSEEERKG